MLDETTALRLPVSAPESGSYVLHYNPERAAFTGGTAASAEKYFSEFVWLIFLWLVVMALFFSSSFGNLTTSLLLSSPLLCLFLMDLSRPSSIEVNSSGLRIHWLHRYCFYSSPWISWNAITSVKLSQSYIPGLDAARCFELTVDHTKRNFWFEIMSVPVTAKVEGKRQTLRFVECGFFHESDLSTFLTAISSFVPSDRVAAEVLAVEQFGEVPSFTALWLDSLQGSKDSKGSTLPDGTVLAEGRYCVIKRLGSGGQAVVYDAVENCSGETMHRSPSETSPGGAGGSPASGGKNAAPTVDHELTHSEAINSEAINSRSINSGAINSGAINSGACCVLKEFVLPVRGGREIKRRAIQNIQREANLLQSFDHKNIVGYKDLFIEGSRAYLVMERIFGETLRKKVVNSGKLPATQVIELALQMCELLEFLHGSDPPVIHRDFTPENLMLTEDGHLKLIDFNVAHRLESSSTRTVVGKHAYVPPEQFRGKPTAQSDIYALGATMCFLLTGEDPEPITRSDLTNDPGVPPELALLIMKATEPNASDRFGSAAEVMEALKGVAGSKPLDTADQSN
jgi:hypothetical protein